MVTSLGQLNSQSELFPQANHLIAKYLLSTIMVFKLVHISGIHSKMWRPLVLSGVASIPELSLSTVVSTSSSGWLKKKRSYERKQRLSSQIKECFWGVGMGYLHTPHWGRRFILMASHRLFIVITVVSTTSIDWLPSICQTCYSVYLAYFTASPSLRQDRYPALSPIRWWNWDCVTCPRS